MRRKACLFRRRSAIPWRRAFLLVLVVFCQGVSSAAQPGAGDPVRAAEQLLATLQGSTSTADYGRAARELGPLVEQARSAQVPVDALHKLRALAERFRERTRDKLVELETATNEQEYELEQLYRSKAWDDLSFALAAFPYWRAWIDLSLADRVVDKDLRPRYLLQAKRGFRAASMQLFQPSLVYGGWFGLGHTAIAEGADQRAIEIFETLDRSLQAEPDHPLAEPVAVELRLLRAKSGDVGVSKRVGTVIDETEARLLRAEAFALLERQRKQKSGARGAAERLRRLIGAGYLDDELMAAILQYRNEIAGQDLGKYTDLIGAEYALANEHFFEAEQKYKAFFNAPADSNHVDLDRFRYHRALADLKGDLAAPAARIAEDLLRRKPSNPELVAATTKLAYIAQAKCFQNQPSSGNRKAAATAARRFLGSAPNDPDADSARLLLAQTTSETGAALKILDGVRSSSQLGGQAAQARFSLFSREFLQSAEDEDAGASAGAAQRGLKVWQRLPEKKKKRPELAIAALQMRAVSDPKPEDVLKDIAIEEQRAGITTLERQALLWARLRVMDRLEGDQTMFEYLSALAQKNLDGWQLEQLYPWVRKIPRADVRAKAIRALLPGLTRAPEMDRRFQLLLGETLADLDEYENVYKLAKTFVTTYPTSGDGWQLLARAAEHTERPHEAERAWRIVTEGAPPAAAVWWDGMLNRIEIRANSTRPKSACELLASLTARQGQMPEGARQRYESLRGTLVCAGRDNS